MAERVRSSKQAKAVLVLLQAGFRRLRFSIGPLIVGFVFFALSLTPSLIPRDFVVQGVLGGLCVATGYFLSYVLIFLYRVLELPAPPPRLAIGLRIALAIPAAGLIMFCLYKAKSWQDSIRLRVEMEPLASFNTLLVVGLTILVFFVLYAIGLLIQRLFNILRDRLSMIISRRAANTLGFFVTVLFLLIVTRNAFVPFALERIDAFYSGAQRIFAAAPSPPADRTKFDREQSLLSWALLGEDGRNFVTGGPAAADIEQFTGRKAQEPIRVYVGRAEAQTPEARASLALAELIRRNAFERRILVIASPTGTGWLDAASHDPLEIMHNGDVASVAVQYSYLQSPFALFFETQSGPEHARALLDAVYAHWKTLPTDRRPELFVTGMSLGAWATMEAFDLFALVDDPINGALWAGPPFNSHLWRRAVEARRPGSPYILPELGDGGPRMVRFAAQHDRTPDFEGGWRKMRFIFLQYGSDPIVFYDPQAIWRAPPWMTEPPAPDVSPSLAFWPLVTNLQLMLDMAFSQAVPFGFGHNYRSRDYIAPWASLTDPRDWSDDETERLIKFCSRSGGRGCMEKRDEQR